MSGIGGSKEGRGVSWYEGRGGRSSKVFIAVVPIIVKLPEVQLNVSVRITRQAPDVRPFRPRDEGNQARRIVETIEYGVQTAVCSWW